MKQSEHNLTRYLLGELSESEQVALEETYFSNPQSFDEITKVESELIDNYVRGRLSDEVRHQFEQFYLAHPERRERVKFAEALATRLDQLDMPEAISEPPERVLPWWQKLFALPQMLRPAAALSVALVSLLLVLASVWLVVEARRVRHELAQAQAALASQEQRQRELQEQLGNERSRADEMTAELERLRNQLASQTATSSPESTIPAFVSLLIRVGSIRGADAGPPATLVIPAGTAEVRLQVRLQEHNYPSYSAVLQAVGGAEVFSRQNLKPVGGKSGATLTLKMPAGRLRTGDYVLTLKATTDGGEVEDLSKSIFRVEKR
jgi:anti-sigma factor RsiW